MAKAARGAPIAKNRSRPKKEWGKDIGSRPGRTDFGNRHLGGGADPAFQARPFSGDRGNIATGAGKSKPAVMKGHFDQPHNAVSDRNRMADDRGKTNNRAVPKSDTRFSETPGAYRSEVFKTQDNTNHSRDHAASGADYHAFSGVGGEAHNFRGRRT